MDSSRPLMSALTYGLSALVVIAAGLHTGFETANFGPAGLIGLFLLGGVACFLLIYSLTSIVTYFSFIPSLERDGHLFSRVHGSYLVHPLHTALVFGLAALCLYTGSGYAWAAWIFLVIVYIAHTIELVRQARQEEAAQGIEMGRSGLLQEVLSLTLGGELVTMAAGVKSIPPWRIKELPADTWVVDVRTKPEFYWNRMQSAKNYPWGSGVMADADSRPKDRPVLVTCFSGHRSPMVAVALRKYGFANVYHLRWGLLYHLLLERGKQETGPFSLTRPHMDPHRRGEDLKWTTRSYVTCGFIALFLAPVENYAAHRAPDSVVIGIGVALGLIGLALGFLSFRGLDRNFRVYAAPRRSGTLVTDGIYAHVRHPMYTGVILALLGWIMMWGSVFAIPLWLALTILYVYKSVQEEEILAEKFPEYHEYRKRTWRFIPYVH